MTTWEFKPRRKYRLEIIEMLKIRRIQTMGLGGRVLKEANFAKVDVLAQITGTQMWGVRQFYMLNTTSLGYKVH